MRVLLNRWNLMIVMIIVSFLLFMRSISKRDGRSVGGIPQQFKVLNKEELARIRSLEVMVDDLQKQLWDAQTYEKQLIEQLKNIDVHGGEKLVEPKQEQAMPPGLGNSSDASDDYLGCQEINQIRIVKIVGKGFTKVVQEGNLNGMKVAVKSAALDVKDVQDCLQSGMYKKETDCYVLASYKVLKEAMMLKQLKHSNIVKLLGLCLRSERSSPHIQERGMTVVVELGKPVVVQDILDLPYHERIRLCIGVAQMLIYLAESPLGSIIIQDFREDQFVMVDKQIKLSDVDDLSSTEADCNSNMQCLVDNQKTNIKCSTNMKCPGMNVKANLLNACKVFFHPLLGLEVPPDFIEKSKYIVQRLRLGLMDNEELVQELLMLSVFVNENEETRNDNEKDENDGYMGY